MKNFLNETGLELLWTHIVSFVTGKSNTALNEAKTYTDEAVNTAIGNIEIPSTEGLASENYVDTKVSELVNSAPETLNTLNELATALGNDPNFATTVANQIGTKANSSDLTSHTGNKSNPHNITTTQIGAMRATNPIGTGSFSMGRKEDSVIGVNSYAFGLDVTASGVYSHAEGSYTIASGQNSHTEGSNTKAIGDYSHAEGSGTKAIGDYSHAEGDRTIAYAEYSHAEGNANATLSRTITGVANTVNYTSHSSVDSSMIGKIITYNDIMAKIIDIDTNNNILTLDKTLSSIDLSEATVRIQYQGATGEFSHTEGINTYAISKGSHSEGYRTKANGEYSHVEGELTTSNGKGSHAEGYETKTIGNYSHAEGYRTKTQGSYSHAEGNYTIAASDYQHVEGKNNREDTENKYAHIVGNGVLSNDRSNAHTLDWDGNAWYSGDVYVGSTSGKYQDSGSKKLATESYVDGKNASDIGAMSANNPVGTGSFSMGRRGNIGEKSFAAGYEVSASGDYSHAEGYSTIASGESSHAEGRATRAIGDYSHAEGQSVIASGNYSHAEGDSTIASGLRSHAEGQGYYTSIKVSGDAFATTYNITGTIDEKIQVGSIITDNNRTAVATITAIDKENLTVTLSTFISSEVLNEKTWWVYCNGIASGDYSHAEGYSTIASGLRSHAEGRTTVASGPDSHAEGQNTISSSSYSHAEGNGTKASAGASHAEGSYTKASGKQSHAEGNNTEASNESSHAEGGSTKASGKYSHAEGTYTIASGEASHAEGRQTVAASNNQHVQGQYNIEDSEGKYAHIVGNGYVDESINAYICSNAHTLDWNGNGWYAGALYVGGTSQNDGKKVLTEDDMDTIANAVIAKIPAAEGVSF